MSKLRLLVVLLAAFSITACANAPFPKSRAVTQFDSAPLAFSQNPRVTQQLTQKFITNEAELESAADRIAAESLEVIDADDEEAISARSTVSLL